MTAPGAFDDQISRLIEWRRDFHAHPELGFDVDRTAEKVAERLRAMLLDEVVTRVGGSGVVGVIRGRGSKNSPVIGLRADMDALPMQELTGLDYASTTNGCMHACGHDGHITMLLGAANYLARTRNFNGTAVVIFQPAEEAGNGGQAMVEDGLMERFGIEKVFALHNAPGIPIGHFGTRSGGLLASADEFEITITGKGCHASAPELGIDPAIPVADIVQGFQSIVTRSVNTADRLVISITQIHMGTNNNIIAEKALMSGTVRSLSRDARVVAEQRMGEVCDGVAKSTGAMLEFSFMPDVPVTHNHEAETCTAIHAAIGVTSQDSVDTKFPPNMATEDFSFMLEARPGAMMFMGNGDTAGLHNQHYDFNDEAIAYGCAYFATLVESGDVSQP